MAEDWRVKVETARCQRLALALVDGHGPCNDHRELSALQLERKPRVG